MMTALKDTWNLLELCPGPFSAFSGCMMYGKLPWGLLHVSLFLSRFCSVGMHIIRLSGSAVAALGCDWSPSVFRVCGVF